MAACAGTTAAADYTEVVVSAGQTRTFNVGDNETFSNYLIDITASNANVQIIPDGANWTVQGVGIKGVNDCGTDRPRKRIIPRVSSGSTGLIENGYLGDGSAHGRQGALWVQDDHEEELIIRNCNVQNWADNGLYCSGPGDPNQGFGKGVVKIEECYAKNNNVSSYRIGTPGSYAADSVVNIDGPVPSVPAGVNARGIWGWYFDDLEVQRTDILIDHPDGTCSIVANHDGEVLYSDSDEAGGGFKGNVTTQNVGNNPDVTMPASVPTSAEDAANGQYGNTMYIDGSPYSGDADYTFATEGEALKSTYNGASINAGDTVTEADDGSYNCSGNVVGGADAFEANGGLFCLDVSDGQADVFWNDQQIDHTMFFNNRIYVVGNGSYSITTIKEPNQWGYLDAVDDGDANVSQNGEGTWTATGSVSSGDPVALLFFGTLEVVDTDANVYLNGDQIDPDNYNEVIENFERSNPLVEYGGATSLFSVTTATVYEGSQALVNDGGTFGSAVSTSGLSDYPSRDNEVHVHFTNASDDNFVAFNFFTQAESDNPDRYSVGLSGVDGEWKMWKTESGSISTLASEMPSQQISGWYRAEIWTDDTWICAELYDDSSDELRASVQADDSTFSSGGIGFRSAGNGEVCDYVILEK